MKNLFILTGASTGIGSALAEHFSQQGETVLAGVRSQKDFDRLSGKNQWLIPVFLDVCEDEQIENLPRLIEQHLKPGTRLVLINNAGIAVSRPWELVAKNEFEKQMATNVTGAVMVTQKCLPHLRKTRGLIINMGSVSGLVASPFLGPYSVSKFALEAFSDSLRREMAFFNVHVCSVNPGPIRTPIWDKGLGDPEMVAEKNDPVYGKLLQKFEKRIQAAVQSALPVEAVVQVVDGLVRSKNPPARVIVAPPAARAAMRVLQVLPSKWVDQMVKRF